MERYLLTLTQLLAKFLIPIRFSSTKMKVTMDSLYTIAQTLHSKKEAYGISAAGEGDEEKGNVTTILPFQTHPLPLP
jgi:hypothetical protein